jgi:hypothetical protein
MHTCSYPHVGRKLSVQCVRWIYKSQRDRDERVLTSRRHFLAAHPPSACALKPTIPAVILSWNIVYEQQADNLAEGPAKRPNQGHAEHVVNTLPLEEGERKRTTTHAKLVSGLRSSAKIQSIC